HRLRSVGYHLARRRDPRTAVRVLGGRPHHGFFVAVSPAMSWSLMGTSFERSVVCGFTTLVATSLTLSKSPSLVLVGRTSGNSKSVLFSGTTTVGTGTPVGKATIETVTGLSKPPWRRMVPFSLMLVDAPMVSAVAEEVSARARGDTGVSRRLGVTAV